MLGCQPSAGTGAPQAPQRLFTEVYRSSGLSPEFLNGTTHTPSIIYRLYPPVGVWDQLFRALCSIRLWPPTQLFMFVSNICSLWPIMIAIAAIVKCQTIVIKLTWLASSFHLLQSLFTTKLSKQFNLAQLLSGLRSQSNINNNMTWTLFLLAVPDRASYFFWLTDLLKCDMSQLAKWSVVRVPASVSF